jgi:hypothetical protein
MAASITVVPNSVCPMSTRNWKASYDFVWSGTYGSSNGKFTPSQLGLLSVTQIEQVIFSDETPIASAPGTYIPVYDRANQEVRLIVAATATEASGTVVASFRVTFIYQP